MAAKCLAIKSMKIRTCPMDAFRSIGWAKGDAGAPAQGSGPGIGTVGRGVGESERALIDRSVGNLARSANRRWEKSQ
jgi:hypothetical protein